MGVLESNLVWASVPLNRFGLVYDVGIWLFWSGLTLGVRAAHTTGVTFTLLTRLVFRLRSAAWALWNAATFHLPPLVGYYLKPYYRLRWWMRRVPARIGQPIAWLEHKIGPTLDGVAFEVLDVGARLAFVGGAVAAVGATLVLTSYNAYAFFGSFAHDRAVVLAPADQTYYPAFGSTHWPTPGCYFPLAYPPHPLALPPALPHPTPPTLVLTPTCDLLSSAALASLEVGIVAMVASVVVYAFAWALGEVGLAWTLLGGPRTGSAERALPVLGAAAHDVSEWLAATTGPLWWVGLRLARWGLVGWWVFGLCAPLSLLELPARLFSPTLSTYGESVIGWACT